MKPYQHNFIELCLKKNVLTFGDFTLKSGRKSTYFFNAGSFCDGESFSELGKCYAQTLHENFEHVDVVFGPAYKGIILSAITSSAMFSEFGRNIPAAYNRKEPKDHGEGGVLVGAPLKGQRVVLIDDVMTAGTAVRHAAELIQQAGGKLAGVLIAIDRQEKGTDLDKTAVEAVAEQFGVPVVSMIKLADVVAYFEESDSDDQQIQAFLTAAREVIA